jgi:hypothetical protein
MPSFRMHRALSIPVDQVMLGWHGPGSCWAQVILIGPQPGLTSTMGYAVLSDGLAARLRNGTQPVKRVVTGLVAQWAYQAELKLE